MRKIFLVLILGVLTALNAQAAFAEDAAAMPPMDEKMAAAMKLMQPGEAHRKLDALTGTFKAKTTMWMSADAPAQISEGTSETKWILDGRFVQQTFKSEFMGRPFEGMGITGYDNVAKEYNSIWLDSMATGIMKGTAQYDGATQTFAEAGTFSCPLTNKKDFKYKSVIKIVDADHYTYEMWHADMKTGKNYKAMDITYSRA